MTWKQVELFKKRVRDYQDQTSKTQAKVAEDLGTSYGTLRFWLSGVRPPKRENLQRAAALFGCSILEFIDDPGNGPEGIGISADRWAKASERDRTLLMQMFDGFLDMPDEMKDLAVKQFRLAMISAKAMKEEMDKIKK